MKSDDGCGEVVVGVTQHSYTYVVQSVRLTSVFRT
jgi:hypothetical protein